MPHEKTMLVSPHTARVALAALLSTFALYAAGCCGACQDNPDAKLPESVPIYPKANSLNRSDIVGVTLASFNAPAKADKVQRFYDKKLKTSWEPVESKWKVRRKLAGASFEYRRFKEKGGKAYLMIDVVNNPSADSTFVEIHHCPGGPLRCKPKS